MSRQEAYQICIKHNIVLHECNLLDEKQDNIYRFTFYELEGLALDCLKEDENGKSLPAIDKDLLSEIAPCYGIDGSVIGYQVKIFDNGYIIFHKEYKTRKGAKIANTKLLQKYHSI